MLNVKEINEDKLINVAKLGDAKAMFFLALRVENRLMEKREKLKGIINKTVEIQQELMDAIQWYKKSANRGYPEAHHNLGLIYLNWKPPQSELALHHFEAAADLGFAKSAMNLAYIYKDIGVKYNLDLAIQYFNLARELTDDNEIKHQIDEELIKLKKPGSQLLGRIDVMPNIANYEKIIQTKKLLEEANKHIVEQGEQLKLWQRRIEDLIREDHEKENAQELKIAEIKRDLIYTQNQNEGLLNQKEFLLSIIGVMDESVLDMANRADINELTNVIDDLKIKKQKEVEDAKRQIEESEKLRLKHEKSRDDMVGVIKVAHNRYLFRDENDSSGSHPSRQLMIEK